MSLFARLPRKYVRGFWRFLTKVIKNRRSYTTLITSSISSLTNFGVSIAVARSGSVEDVALFAIGFAAYALITGMSRAMVTEPSAARLLSLQDLRASGRAISFHGLFLGIPIIAAGFVFHQPYLILSGVCANAIALGDYSKYLSMVFGRPRVAMGQEALRLFILVLVLLVPATSGDPLTIYIGWLVGTAVAAYVGSLVQRIAMRPTLASHRISFRESSAYGLDYLLGSGSSQITTFILGGVASSTVNAAIRGSGTLFGPITLVATSVRALTIPFLSRGIRRGETIAPSANLSGALMLVAAPLLIGINFIPNSWGELLLGETWSVAKDVLVLLSIETLLSMLSNVPFSAHRSLGAYRRTLGIRSILAPTRVFVIVGAGVLGGHVLAAAAMVLTSAISMAVWWISYYNLSRSLKSENWNSCA